jgi:phosphoribosylamine-glycine ligase
MYGSGFGEMLFDISSGKTPEIKWSSSFGAAVTLSIPPYPTEIRLPKAKGVPIEGVDPEDLEQLLEFYLYDAMLGKGKKLETSGNFGYIGAVLGAGGSIDAAFSSVNKNLKRVQIPDCQYRTDIKESTEKRYNQLYNWGWL